MLCTVERYDSRCGTNADCTGLQRSRVTRHCQTLARSGIVVARAGSTAMDQTMVGAGSTARVDGWIIKSRDDVKANLQILEQIGTGAEVRTTSDSGASRETCTRNQIWKRRYLSTKEAWIQESRRKNESQLVSEDTTMNMADIETKVHTSERLTLMQRQIPPRQEEERLKALVCLTLTMTEREAPCEPRRSERRIPCEPRRSERKTPCEPRRGWRRLRRMQ